MTTCERDGMGIPETARKHYDTLSTLGLTAEQVPDLPATTRTALVRYLLRWKEYGAARRCYQELIASRGPLVTMYDGLARAYLGEDQPQLALETLRRRHRVKTSVSSQIMEARTHLALGEIVAAQAIATDLTTHHADALGAWDLQSDICLTQNDWQGAEAALRTRETLRPEAIGTAIGLCQLWQARGDPDKALLWAQTAMARAEREQRQPGVQLLRLLEALYRDTHQTVQAENVADQLVRRQKLELDELRQALDPESATTEPELALVDPPDTEAPLATTHIFPAVIIGAVEPTDTERRRLEGLLTRHFQHADFRPGQIDVMTAIQRGESVLAVMPTGSGKSLCYQLISQLLPATTLVITPLVALMKDQIDGLPAAIARQATSLNYTLDGPELDARIARTTAGEYKLLYAAPERLRQRPFLHALQAGAVSLLVVDEAHCVSLWGHDFRPDYLFISKAWQELGQPPILAMTATATPRVQDDIQNALGRMRLIVTDVHRPNLRLEALPLPNEMAKRQALLRLCRNIKGSGIVYARARRACEELARQLRGQGVEAIHYHAGLDERATAQDRFMSGTARVVVATIAFGMGVDKPNVRFIIHYDLPKSLENYYQEAGRAGRDGLPARCVLFHSAGDRVKLAHFLRQNTLHREFLRSVYTAIESRVGRRGSGLVALADLQRDVAADETDIRVAVHFLERAGLLQRGFDLPRTAVLMVRRQPDTQDEELASFLSAARLRPRQRDTRDVAAIAAEAGLDLQTIEAKLLGWAGEGWLDYRGVGRDMLLQLPAPPADSRQRVAAMLADHRYGQEGRVEELLTYADTRGCRHGFISRYFGGLRLDRCQACDNCLGRAVRAPQDMPSTKPRTPVQPSDRTVALVLQAIQQLPYPLGRTGLQRALCGSARSPVGAGRFPLFGALSSMSQKDVGRRILWMVQQGLLEHQAKGPYQLLKLSGKGSQWLTDRPQLTIAPEPAPREAVGRRLHQPGPHEEVTRPVPAADSDSAGEGIALAYDPALFERLKSWRLEAARHAGVPPYVIFHNSVLQRIASHQPRTLDELADVKGVGPKKLAQYGQAVLEIVSGSGQ